MHFVRQDYNEVFKQLRQSPIGDIVALNKIAGPTICCAWVCQLDIRCCRKLTYCKTGSRHTFTTELVGNFQATTQVHQVDNPSRKKSVRLLNTVPSLQHYPRNNCGLGSPLPDLAYYLDHSNGRQISST